MKWSIEYQLSTQKKGKCHKFSYVRQLVQIVTNYKTNHIPISSHKSQSIPPPNITQAQNTSMACSLVVLIVLIISMVMTTMKIALF